MFIYYCHFHNLLLTMNSDIQKPINCTFIGSVTQKKKKNNIINSIERDMYK